MGRCENCAHWKEGWSDYYESADGVGMCLMASWNTGVDGPVSIEANDLAYLHTPADFGCAEFKAADESAEGDD